MPTQYNSIKVYLTGDGYYPKITITRDETGKRRYWISSNYDLKRIQLLFDAHQGHIYVDIENSTIELTKQKFIVEK